MYICQFSSKTADSKASVLKYLHTHTPVNEKVTSLCLLGRRMGSVICAYAQNGSSEYRTFSYWETLTLWATTVRPRGV